MMSKLHQVGLICIVVVVALVAQTLALEAHANERDDVTPYKDARKALPELFPAAAIVRIPVGGIKRGAAGIDESFRELEEKLEEASKRRTFGPNRRKTQLEAQRKRFEKLARGVERIETLVETIRLDEKRPIYAAFTTWGGESYLDDLEDLHTPLPANVPRGVHVRLALPVDGADAIEQTDEARLDDEANWATIDLRVATLAGETRVEVAEEVAPPDDATVPDTPAYRAFAGAATPSAIYVDFEALADAATIFKARELSESLEATIKEEGGPTPRFFSTYEMGLTKLTTTHFAGRDGFSEYADAATWGGIGGASLRDSHLVATRTEHGARIFEASGAEPVELPVAGSDDAILTLETTYDATGAAPRALAADWAMASAQTPANLQAIVRGDKKIPAWGPINQPAAFFAVLAQGEIAPHMPLPHAVRAHFYEPEKGSKLYDDIPDRLADEDNYPMALSAAFERSESTRIRLEHYLQEMSSGNFLDLDWTFEEVGDDLILRLTRHAPLEAYFDEKRAPQALDRLRMTFAPKAAADWFEEAKPSAAPDLPETFVDTAPDEALLETHSVPAATVVSMTDREAERPGEMPRIAPDASPVSTRADRDACLAQTVELLTRQVRKPLSIAVQPSGSQLSRSRTELDEGAFERIEDTIERCDEDHTRQRAKAIVGRELWMMAMEAESNWLIDRASDLYARACRWDEQRACRGARRLSTHRLEALPTLTKSQASQRTSRPVMPFAAHVRIDADERLSFDGDAVDELDDWHGDRETSALAERLSEREPVGGWTLLDRGRELAKAAGHVVAIDADAEVEALGALRPIAIAALEDESIEPVLLARLDKEEAGVSRVVPLSFELRVDGALAKMDRDADIAISVANGESVRLDNPTIADLTDALVDQTAPVVRLAVE